MKELTCWGSEKIKLRCMLSLLWGLGNSEISPSSISSFLKTTADGGLAWVPSVCSIGTGNEAIGRPSQAAMDVLAVREGRVKLLDEALSASTCFFCL